MAIRTFEEWYKDFLKYNQNGYVPVKFITPKGNKLGRWVKNVRLGEIKLTCEQKQLLNDVNFIWTKQRKSRKFEEWYEDLLKYSQNGYVSCDFITPEGNRLGAWVQRVRMDDTKLTSEQKQMLKNANFVWKVKGKYRKFEEWFWDFLKYNQDGYVPCDFITPEGNRLGAWIHNIRSGHIKLTDDQKQLLDDANFAWLVRKGRKRKYN